ncbi:hypothetical protein V1281_002568 [Nitrobacteraceae bacterium AZCC 2161]
MVGLFGEAYSLAVVEGRWQTDMSMENADDLTDLLNRLDREAKAPKH